LKVPTRIIGFPPFGDSFIGTETYARPITIPFFELCRPVADGVSKSSDLIENKKKTRGKPNKIYE
jgi:hypothetical protein